MHYEESNFITKAEAVIKENKSSLFGYIVVSIKKLSSYKKKFGKAIASSFLDAVGKRTFKPTNVLDGNENTSWTSKKSANPWIVISSAKAQSVTGLTLHFGFNMENGSVFRGDMPVEAIVELSDGSRFDLSANINGYLSFGRIVKTTYIKITLPTDDPQTDSIEEANYYITDIYVD